MKDRRKKLLRLIIEDYIKTAQPVASNLLVNKYKISLSPATIRNEMMSLEEEGYLLQPHVSAGRLPTEKAYRFYIEEALPKKELDKNKQQQLKGLLNKLKEESIERKVKVLAKGLAALSSETVFVSFSLDNFYYTGLTNLFHQPEFADPEIIYSVSQIIDHFDEALTKLFEEASEEPKMLLGKDNPFGQECGVVLTGYKIKKQDGLLGILGPMRMDWAGNLALLSYSKELIRTI